MKSIKRFVLTGILIGSVVLVVSCSLPRATGGKSTVSTSIECQVFYRPSATQSLSEGPIIILTKNGDHEVIDFDDLQFNVQYQDDQFEGQSLFISVTNPDTGNQITGQLYQIDREQGLSNQFQGGHGFTGLAYVSHPTSLAELQYFCEAR